MSGRPWTAADDLDIEEMIVERQWTDVAIARRLGRTANAVNIRRKRLGLPSRRDGRTSSRAVTDLLGVACSKTVTRWIEQGFLKARRGQAAGGAKQWVITQDALLAFLAEPSHWQLWKPEAITDKGLREWACEIRRGERYLSTAEVGRRLGVTSHAVSAWIRSGKLPAFRRGNWFVRERDLRGFVPPYQGPKTGMHQANWSHAEDEQLIALRSVGRTFDAIAQELGRSVCSVSNRWYRLSGAA